MKLLGIFLTACVVLATAQAAAVALAILLLCGLIYSLFIAPKETLGFIALFLVLGAFQAYPLAFLGVVAILAIAKLVGRQNE